METKQKILDKLLEAVQETRAGSDITAMDYHKDTKETVILTYKNGGRKTVNVSADSGISMIRDVCSVIN